MAVLSPMPSTGAMVIQIMARNAARDEFLTEASIRWQLESNVVKSSSPCFIGAPPEWDKRGVDLSSKFANERSVDGSSSDQRLRCLSCLSEWDTQSAQSSLTGKLSKETDPSPAHVRSFIHGS
jgi:hypothetical protein